MEATQTDQIHEDIVKTIREPLLILDHDLMVVLASRSFYEFFKVTPEETVGQLVYDLGNKQWDIPKLRELLETILPQKTSFDNYDESIYPREKIDHKRIGIFEENLRDGFVFEPIVPEVTD